MSIEKWYMELPPFTKYYLSGAVATTILISLGMASPYIFMASFELLVKNF
jgi:hypothetical protein